MPMFWVEYVVLEVINVYSTLQYPRTVQDPKKVSVAFLDDANKLSNTGMLMDGQNLVVQYPYGVKHHARCVDPALIRLIGIEDRGSALDGIGVKVSYKKEGKTRHQHEWDKKSIASSHLCDQKYGRQGCQHDTAQGASHAYQRKHGQVHMY